MNANNSSEIVMMIDFFSSQRYDSLSNRKTHRHNEAKEAMAAIIRGEALPSIQFSETSIAAHGSADGSVQAVGRTGVRAFEKLPTCE